MRSGVLFLAGMGLVASVTLCVAQDLRGPRELPSPAFRGPQYVDSGGCVFLRAGIGGNVNWVPRVGPDRRQLCGFPPSFTPEPAVVAEAPPPEVQREPVAVTEAVPVRPAAPAPAGQPRMRPAVSKPAAPVASATRGCPANAPFGARILTSDGRQALVCAATDAQLAAFVRRQEQGRAALPAPLAEAEARVPPVARTADAPAQLSVQRLVCPASAPVARRFALRDGGSTVLCTTADGGLDVATAAFRTDRRTAARIDPAPVPKGYARAWKDGRLNPMRGLGTPEGQAAQDRIWTREVPARLVSRTRPDPGIAPRRGATLSASGGRAVRGFVVQVGSYAAKGHAEGAARRLAALGLPVARGRGTVRGQPVAVIAAGPFGSVDAAQSALAGVQRAGFADAFIR